MRTSQSEIRQQSESGPVETKAQVGETTNEAGSDQATLPRGTPGLIELQAYFDGLADEATEKMVEAHLSMYENLMKSPAP